MAATITHERLHGYLTPSSYRRQPDRSSRLTPGPVPAGDSDIPGVLPLARRPIRHSRRAAGSGRPPCHGTSLTRRPGVDCQVCCLRVRPVFTSVTRRAAGSGRPLCLSVSRHEVSDVLPPSVIVVQWFYSDIRADGGLKRHTSITMEFADSDIRAEQPLRRVQPVIPSESHRAAGSGHPQVLRLLVPSPRVSLPARQARVSTSRRLGYEHPERTVSKLYRRRFLKPVAGPTTLALSAPPSVGSR